MEYCRKHQVLFKRNSQFIDFDWKKLRVSFRIFEKYLDIYAGKILEFCQFGKVGSLCVNANETENEDAFPLKVDLHRAKAIFSFVFVAAQCEHKIEQECIPVGCVPSAAVAVSLGGGVSSRGGLFRGGVWY